MPKITVITAAYNCSHTLKCALASLLGQTYADFEAWIVGDCCTDDSERVVTGFKDFRLHWANLPQCFGSQSGPNNEAFKRAKGEYIAYLGQDDLWFPSHLKSLMDTIEQTNADFVHSMLLNIHPIRPPMGAAVGLPQYFYENHAVSPSTWLCRREVIAKCAPWPSPENLIAGIDFVFQRRIHSAGFRFAGSNQITALKFPSPWWQIYSLHQGYPQLHYLTRIQQEPILLLNDLLMELTIASTRDGVVSGAGMAFRMALKKTCRRAADWYGRDRWPVSAMFVWKNRRLRRLLPRLRGLVP